MTREISTVAVLGSGTMGAGIAAHCASRGYDVLLADLKAKDGEANAVAAKARDAMREGRAPMIEDDEAFARIDLGNFEDDIERIGQCDLIVEVIIEDLKIKRDLFTRLAEVRKPDAIVTSNTSGIRLASILEDMPEGLRQNAAITHFFNPVKVMKLVELVPGEDTEPEVMATLVDFIGSGLGKGVVYGKDTVNFIANRIGCFWILAGLDRAGAAFEEGVRIEDIDAAMSAPVGVPSTGLFGLVDLVGMDVMKLVSLNMKENLAAGDRGVAVAQFPPAVERMYERGQIGRKAGQGFYRQSKTEDGARVRHVFDLQAEDWRLAEEPALPEGCDNLAGLLFSDTPVGRYAWEVMGATLLYAAELTGEIADDIVNEDRAMEWGFAWKEGPFKMLDRIGAAKVIARLEAEGKPLPKMLQVLKDAGAESFYRNEGREFLGLDGAWHKVP